MGLSADIKLTLASSNTVQLLITVNKDGQNMFCLELA